jgi:hypothetical protein
MGRRARRAERRRRRRWLAVVAAVLAVGCAGTAALALSGLRGRGPAGAQHHPPISAGSSPQDVDLLPYPQPPLPPSPPLPSGAVLERLHLLIRPALAAEDLGLPAGTPPPAPAPAGGWLPGHRIVAYYGNPLSPTMGVLAWYPPEEAMAHLRAQADAYAAADPTHPVVPAIELVGDVAQGSPGPDGAYRLRMPYRLVADELALARRHGALLILDVQVGRSTVAQEVPYFLPFLEQPDVMLALDPEFDMPPGQVPGRQIGTMSASEINWAVRYVAQLVAQGRLPPKMVVVHQFTDGMLPDWRGIRLEPGVQFVLDTDGYGSQPVKLSNYQRYVAAQPVPPVRYGGIKLFYKYDVNLLTPAQVVGLQPSPSLVIYQ